MATDVTTEQFSLRWNNFHSNLKSGIHDLLQQAEMVDVTLAVEGHFLQAHKVVLSICSPYFKQMFKTNPCKHPIVILKDVGHENMRDILQFMYMGEVSVLRENLSAFLRTAEVLQVKGLTGDDPGEDQGLQQKESNNTPNDLYDQLIETTTEIDTSLQSTPPPPQTSPLPLSCPKKQTKANSPSHSSSKRQKVSDPYLGGGGYNRLLPLSEESEMPKPSVDYKSCDFTNATQQVRDSNKPVVGGEIDEAKDYSKGAVWRGELTNVTQQGQMEGVGGTSGGGDQGGSEQDSALYPTDSKGHVICPYCCRKFVNRYNLKVHIRDKHESKSATDLDCQVCGKTMRNQSCLRVHLYHHRKQQMEAAGLVS